MSLPKWLRILQTVGLAALAVSPLAPIATQVGAAIAEAEAIFLEEGSGPQKLEHVLTAAEKAAETAQALGVTIGPQEVRAVGAEAISTAVDVTNLVAKAKKPKRQPEPQPEKPDILPRSDR